MKTNQWLLMSLAVIGLTGLSGCKNAIIGDWRAMDTDSGCSSKTRFTMDDSEEGSGTMYIGDGVGCLTCDFDIRNAEDKGDGRYTGELSFGSSCNCNGVTRFDWDCLMNDDEDRIDCTLDSACTLGSNEYEKLD